MGNGAVTQKITVPSDDRGRIGAITVMAIFYTDDVSLPGPIGCASMGVWPFSGLTPSGRDSRPQPSVRPFPPMSASRMRCTR